MATSPKEISFIVPGQLQGAASVRVGAPRGNGDTVRLTARPGEDVVVLTVANGPTLVLHPENARDLLLAQSASGTRDGGRADGVAVSARLGWPGLEAAATRGATRGWMGEAVLSAFEIVTGVAKDSAVDLATAAITRKLDGAVNAGVYQLAADPLPPSLKQGGLQPANIQAAPDGGPLLVLIHGTFVDTVSTFGKLWTAHPQAVRDLFTHYGGRVYALDHPTLAHSPIANALTLVQAMPAGARLHLVTHSRGGLVAEILARACGGGALATQELAFFKGAGYATHRAQLRELVNAAQAKRLKVERTVRVACPAHGTLLASKRLDAYLSVLRWGLELANVPVAPELVDFLHEVARRRADPAQLPGLEAMMPESPVVAWLNSRSEPVPGDLRVVAGDMEGDSVGSWVKTLLSDAFYWTDNDLVVQTRSMYGGMARSPLATGPGASFMLDRGAKVSHFNYFANQRTVDAVAAALMQGTPDDFAAIGPLSWAGQDASGTRAARAVAQVARAGGHGGGTAGRDRAAGHPRLQPQGRRQAHMAGRRLHQRTAQAGVEPGYRFTRGARRAAGRRIRRADRAPRRHARGDRLRLRLAPADRGRGAPSCRHRRRRAGRAGRQRPAGAPARAFDGRARRTHPAAGKAGHVEAHDGARWRAAADAGHAQRRLVVAHADAVGRRHLRQHARRARLALRQPGRATDDGGLARLHPAAGGAARCRCRPGARGHLAEARRRRHGRAAAPEPLARAGYAARHLRMGRAAAGRARPGRGAAPQAGRAVAVAGGGCVEDGPGGGAGALHARGYRDGRGRP